MIDNVVRRCEWSVLVALTMAVTIATVAVTTAAAATTAAVGTSWAVRFVSTILLSTIRIVVTNRTLCCAVVVGCIRRVREAEPAILKRLWAAAFGVWSIVPTWAGGSIAGREEVIVLDSSARGVLGDRSSGLDMGLS